MGKTFRNNSGDGFKSIKQKKKKPKKQKRLKANDFYDDDDKNYDNYLEEYKSFQNESDYLQAESD